MLYEVITLGAADAQPLETRGFDQAACEVARRILEHRPEGRNVERLGLLARREQSIDRGAHRARRGGRP